MKAFLRWLSRIIGTALTVILIIILFPYISRIAAKLLPDESGAAIRTSAILASRFRDTARLETLQVEEDGVLNYDIQAALLGSVANINIQYLYEASFGLDLTKVSIQRNGSSLTLLLPQPELILDGLRPSAVVRDDFWYPGFSDADYEKLLETERQHRREVYLSGEEKQHLLDSSVSALDRTIKAWLEELSPGIELQYVWANTQDASADQ